MKEQQAIVKGQLGKRKGEKWDSKRMFIIRFNYDECNVINLMTVVGMLEMNCTINGLVIWQMC
jgi:hypothetical protein